MAKAYTDNTNAADPPGGKRHNPSIGADDELPPERGLKTAGDDSGPPAKKRKPASKRAAATSAR